MRVKRSPFLHFTHITPLKSPFCQTLSRHRQLYNRRRAALDFEWAIKSSTSCSTIPSLPPGNFSSQTFFNFCSTKTLSRGQSVWCTAYWTVSSDSSFASSSSCKSSPSLFFSLKVNPIVCSLRISRVVVIPSGFFSLQTASGAFISCIPNPPVAQEIGSICRLLGALLCLSCLQVQSY